MKFNLYPTVFLLFSFLLFICCNSRLHNKKYVLSHESIGTIAEIIEFESDKFFYTCLDSIPENLILVAEGNYVIKGDSILLYSPKPQFENYGNRTNKNYIDKFIDPNLLYTRKVVSFDSIFMRIEVDSLIYEFRNERRIFRKL